MPQKSYTNDICRFIGIGYLLMPELALEKTPNQINKEMEKAGDAYLRMSTLRSHKGTGAFLTELEINKMIRELIQTYSDTIEAYCNLPESKKTKSREIDWLLEAKKQQGDYTYTDTFENIGI